MKKKILSLVLFFIMLVGIMLTLSGCGDNNSEKEASNEVVINNQENVEDDKVATTIEQFLKYMNSKDYSNAIELIDTDIINSKLNINLPKEEFGNGLAHTFNKSGETIKYEINSVEKIDKDYTEDANENYNGATVSENQKKIINMFEEYDLYKVQYTLSSENGSTDSFDILIIKDDNSSFAGSVLTLGLFNYYYSAVYNRPVVSNQD